jgi:hypothetical protein
MLHSRPCTRVGTVSSISMKITLPEKADTAMYEDENDDRFEAAVRLAELDPAQGAAALRSIAADEAFDPDTRFEAAARLAEVDEAQAAEALASIVADDAFDPDIRSEAAARLAEVDQAQAATPWPTRSEVSGRRSGSGRR